MNRSLRLALPALQSDVRFAEYVVDVKAAQSDRAVDVEQWSVEIGTDAEMTIARLLAADRIPWEHKREDQMKSYDLRPQVESLELASREGEGVRLRMRLKNDSGGSGRPEQVVAALGLPPPMRIHRVRLILAGTSPVREAVRRQGRYGG